MFPMLAKEILREKKKRVIYAYIHICVCIFSVFLWRASSLDGSGIPRWWLGELLCNPGSLCQEGGREQSQTCLNLFIYLF